MAFDYCPSHSHLRKRLFHSPCFLNRTRISEAQARDESRRLTQLLWSLRVEEGPARAFVVGVRAGMLDALMAAEPNLGDQREQVDRMSAALAVGGPLAALDLASLGGRDGSPLHVNLLTLHSAKGCEYDVVIMVGLDLGNLPWRNELAAARRESRRLFYVGLTRARDEIHMLYSGYIDTARGRMHWGRSPFLDELEARMTRRDLAPPSDEFRPEKAVRTRPVVDQAAPIPPRR
jgi:DNA helicase II / ATP-dependent DNA helicase PcrA